MIGKLGLHLIDTNGRWHFVGSVPANLAYSGTPEQLETARAFGPGLAGVTRRTWSTETAAIDEAKRLGYAVEARQAAVPVASQTKTQVERSLERRLGGMTQAGKVTLRLELQDGAAARMKQGNLF